MCVHTWSGLILASLNTKNSEDMIAEASLQDNLQRNPGSFARFRTPFFSTKIPRFVRKKCENRSF